MTTDRTAEMFQYHDDPRVQRVCERLDPASDYQERDAIQAALSFGDRIETAIEIAILAMDAVYGTDWYEPGPEESAALRGRLRAWAS